MGCRPSDISEELDATRMRVKILTQFLCIAMTRLENLKKLDGLPEDLHKWWGDHKEWDKKRKKEEKRQEFERMIEEKVKEAEKKIRQEFGQP